MVEALHCSSCFLVFRGVLFAVGEEDHRTDLALHVTLSECQGFCDIVRNGPVILYSGSFINVRALKLLACSIDDD